MNEGKTKGAPVGIQPPAGAPSRPKTKVTPGIHFRLCCWALKHVADSYPALVAEFIMERASEVAVGATMSMLDSKRISHCFRCPSIFTLRRTAAGRYACQTHYAQEEKAVAASNNHG